MITRERMIDLLYEAAISVAPKSFVINREEIAEHYNSTDLQFFQVFAQLYIGEIALSYLSAENSSIH